MSTHAAVVTVSPRAPLQIHQAPTIPPKDNELRVRVEWTASTPLDLHQADGGLLVKHPQVLGDGVAGTVIETGPLVQKHRPGDKVFGFTWRNQAEKAHQIYVTAPEFLFGRIPSGFRMQEVVTLPNNFVTAWQTLVNDFGFDLPWPKPRDFRPRASDGPILIWGASSSSGTFAVQILKYYGYSRVLVTASKTHHAMLKGFGARECFDYRDPGVVENIQEYISSQKMAGIPYILDCIGSRTGSVEFGARIATQGSKVAILLPVIVKDAADGVPEYEMDVTKSANWRTGVEAIGVRTHFYLDNQFLKDHLQSEIMPAALEMGVVKPNNQVVVEGKTLLERAETALGKLRRKEVSGARLVWRVAEDDDGDQ